ncbi:hypothetical protein B9Z51_16820 [Limnohabitans sp. T6-5]|nr:hypothetical protein B9Z51_16820 [Limnohabitans sp. T6-5]
MLGKAIPTQDKLRVLADWLQVSPDELRFGREGLVLKASEGDAAMDAMNMADREMLNRYLALPLNERKTVREVVVALSMAAVAKSKT